MYKDLCTPLPVSLNVHIFIIVGIVILWGIVVAFPFFTPSWLVVVPIVAAKFLDHYRDMAIPQFLYPSSSTGSTSRCTTIIAKILFAITCLAILGIYAGAILAFVTANIWVGWIVIVIALAMTMVAGCLYKSHLRPIWRKEKQRLSVAPAPTP